MSQVKLFSFGCIVFLFGAISAWADVKIAFEKNAADKANPDFKFKTIPSPAKENSARKAKISIVQGQKDPNSAELSVLNDGKLPQAEDEPDLNFFFDVATAGGKLLVDLESIKEIKAIYTYSWHVSTRAPQVYKLYASDGTGENFKKEFKEGSDPTKQGWKLIATVDTRPKKMEEYGGQYGVSISDDKAESLGKYRYLLLDVSRTGADDNFDNTFFSEICVTLK
jgi:hypothetical protein